MKTSKFGIRLAFNRKRLDNVAGGNSRKYRCIELVSTKISLYELLILLRLTCTEHICRLDTFLYCHFAIFNFDKVIVFIRQRLRIRNLLMSLLRLLMSKFDHAYTIVRRDKSGRKGNEKRAVGIFLVFVHPCITMRLFNSKFPVLIRLTPFY